MVKDPRHQFGWDWRETLADVGAGGRRWFGLRDARAGFSPDSLKDSAALSLSKDVLSLPVQRYPFKYRKQGGVLVAHAQTT